MASLEHHDRARGRVDSAIVMQSLVRRFLARILVRQVTPSATPLLDTGTAVAERVAISFDMHSGGVGQGFSLSEYDAAVPPRFTMPCRQNIQA